MCIYTCISIEYHLKGLYSPFKGKAETDTLSDSRQTDRPTDRQEPNIQLETDTGHTANSRQTDEQTDRQADRQTDSLFCPLKGI